MDRVLDRLFVGDQHDLAETVPLRALGFTAVLDLRDGEHPRLPGVDTLSIGNRDGDPWKDEQVGTALQFIFDRVRGGKVLVACAAGMSRSASVAVAYLVRCGWSPAEAYDRVRQARPEVAPVSKMIESALRASGALP